jgi:hypothetical protein
MANARREVAPDGSDRSHVSIHDEADIRDGEIQVLRDVVHDARQALLELAQQFEKVLDIAIAEEELQTFLRDNPGLLDLRAVRVIPKVKLGAEYVTDFVVQLPGDEYLLVEIERASHALYTQANNPTAQLTHAMQQVEDWLEWAYDNLTYLRSQFPGIHEPRGLVVIGRGSTLTEKSRRALRRRNVMSRIQVITYDELLEGVRRIAANLGS